MFAFKALVCLLLALPSVVLSQSNTTTLGCSGTVTSTGGRKIGIAIDSSGSMATTDPNFLRIAAGKAIVASLLPSDRVTIIDFDDSVRIVSPLGPPSTASFAGIDAAGGTYIALGVQAAIDQITKDPNDLTSGISGVVVLTDGQDTFQTELVTQLQRATSLGIRVSFGFLSPGDATDTQDPSILTAILATGGIYSTIDSDTAQANFVSLVLTHGLTAVDAGTSGSTLLFPGLVTAGNVSSTSGAKAFIYDAQAAEVLNFTVTAIADESFDFKLIDKTAGNPINTASTGTIGQASILFTVPASTQLELDVSTTNATSGLFTVQLTSSVNRTITVCGNTQNGQLGNNTGPVTPNNGTFSNSTFINGNSTNLTATGRPTPTPTMPVFTGAANVVRGVAIAAVFPALLALGL